MSAFHFIVAMTAISFVFWLVQLVFALVDTIRQRQMKRLIKRILDGQTKGIPLPAVTVVVPTFNERIENVKATVRSILAQEGVNPSVIVVDDGSDRTRYDEVATDKRVTLIRFPENRGKREAQIAGFERATGRLDCDCR